jgi:hypothetical protein
MITIRSSADVSEPTLISLEATLTTPHGRYAISSDGAVADFSSSLADGLFGAISWPQSRLRLAPRVVLDQQIFLPHDNSAVAIAWQLRGEGLMPIHLSVAPFFAACAPRSYRDSGFRVQSDEEGGRLAWLPNVLGPQIIADSNGRYIDKPARSTPSINSGNLVAPGSFEFELSCRPSVLIISKDAVTGMQRNHGMGVFLAGLLPRNCSSKNHFVRSAPTISRPGRLLAA